MAQRTKLNSEELENVVGGTFNFYTKDDKNQCYVDGMGTFYCSPEASKWVIEQVKTSGAAISSVVAEAMDKGLFWK